MKRLAFSKKLAFALATLALSSNGNVRAADNLKKVNYDLLLYFSNGELYHDVLTLEFDGLKVVKGYMHVPNDFDADLDEIEQGDDSINSQSQISFHVKLPPKYDTAFPGGLTYRLTFPTENLCPTSFCPDRVLTDRFVGLVYTSTAKRPSSRYAGSVVGFALDAAP
jgi:hypothetical protein